MKIFNLVLSVLAFILFIGFVMKFPSETIMEFISHSVIAFNLGVNVGNNI